MVEAIQQFFENLFGNAYLVGFVISMIPIIELKGGILYMIGQTGNVWLSYLVGFLGSSLMAPILLLVFMPLINWAKKTKLLRGIATWLENHFRKKSDNLEKKANAEADAAAALEGDAKSAEEVEARRRKKIDRAKYFGLFAFTAIPLPLTGCWTASIVASILHLDYKKSLLFIILGNIVAGAAITLLGGVLQIAFFQ